MRKQLKKLGIVILALVLVIGMCPPFAVAEGNDGKGTLYISAAPPRNQENANSLVGDLFGSPSSAGTSNTAGTLIDVYVDKQNSIRDSFAATAKRYENAWNKSGKVHNFDRMIKAENASSVAGMKGMGAAFAGKVYGGYCLGKDVSEYLDKSKHRHSSLAFLDQTLRGFNIIAGGLDYGGVKMAKPLAIGGGILKDVVGGDTFSGWANKQDNVALDFGDYVIDKTNEYTYTAMEYYYNLFNGTDDADIYGRPPYGTGVYKPNIYLYPEKKTDITVEFGLPALLTQTIPDYNGIWQVTVWPDGRLIDGTSGDEAGYLFYESETDPALFTYDNGWVIPADDRSEQFNRVLGQYGFNTKETSDFTEFWTEKLPSGVDYIMVPQMTQAVDTAMPVKITPKPDKCYRMWFAFVPFKGNRPAQPVIEAMDRDGYTVIEWGGFILK